MDDFLTLAACTHPERLALLDGSQHITYAELNTKVAELSSRLTAQGVQRGQRVAVLLDRSHDAVTLIHALVRIGASIVPLNTRLTADEMHWQFNEADCLWIIRTIADSPLKESLHLDDLPPASVPAPHFLGAIELDTEFGILFTSGTSGQPKGAILLWKNLFWSATASAFRLGILPSDRWLLSLPLYHIGGLSILLRSALYGTTVVLPNFDDDKFDLASLWERVRATETSLLSLVPTMLHHLLNRYKTEIWSPSLRLILLGGAAATPDLTERALKQNLPIATTYGLTECASQVATATPESVRLKPGSVGKPLPGILVEIRDKDGSPLPAQEIGEIWVSGDVVMFGYLKQVKIHEWLHTGDLGYLDVEGDLWIIQRRNDLIISGGENVYPAEVEEVLMRHPAISDACVVGLPHPSWGQQVAAALVLKSKAVLDEDELISFCRQHLAGYKLPRKISFLKTLPQTPSGKVQRQKVIKIIEKAKRKVIS